MQPRALQPTVRQAGGTAQLSAKVAELERVIARLSLAREITHRFIDSTGQVEKLMEVIFQSVIEVLQAEAGSLWMVDWRTRENVCQLAAGPAKDQVLNLKLAAGKGIVGEVIATAVPKVVLDVHKDEGFNQNIDATTGFVTKSLLCMPLRVGSQVYGAIQIINKKGGVAGRFDEHDRHLVEDLASSAALAIKNARLLETESRVKEMNTLLELSRKIVATLDVEQVLETVVNIANELADVKDGAVALVDEKTSELHLAVLSGARKVEPEKHAQLTLVMRTVHKAGRVAYIADLNEYKRSRAGDHDGDAWTSYLEENKLGSVWAAPLKDEEGVLGVLLYESEALGFASGNKADMLNILSNQATLALRNASMFKNVPISSVLRKSASSGQRVLQMVRSKWLWGVLVAAVFGLALHFLPMFRSVSGPCLVEARLGQGVFLPVAGRVEEVLVVEGQKVEQGTVLARLDREPLELLLMQAESRLLLIERQIVEEAARAAGDATAMRRAAIERVTAQAEADKSRADLAQVELRAPTAGVVLTPRPQELTGRVFPLGAELLRIADPSKLAVVVHLPEEQVLDVEPGQSVSGMLRAVPGRGFRGRVRHVGRAYRIPAEALDQEQVAAAELETGFVAEVEVQETDVVLRPGMTGQANIRTPDASALVRLYRRARNYVAFAVGI